MEPSDLDSNRMSEADFLRVLHQHRPAWRDLDVAVLRGAILTGAYIAGADLSEFGMS
jgi:uncharacterized protein YjbI with pentapeptide repeats